MDRTGDVLASAGSDEPVGRWPGSAARGVWRDLGRPARAAAAAVILAAVALAGGVSLDGASPADPTNRQAAEAAASPPTAPASPSPSGTPVRVTPLCEQDTEFIVLDEPPMDGPPSCPAGTPAGWYASTAFVGNSSLLPFTFTLPDRWHVVRVKSGFQVDLRTRGRTAITVVSLPYAYRRGSPEEKPAKMLRRIARQAGLTVTRPVEVPPGQRSWLAVDVFAADDTLTSDACRRNTPCVPVLASGYDRRGEVRAVGVPVGARSRLLMHAVTGAPLAVWIWDVPEPVDPAAGADAEPSTTWEVVTAEALAVVDSVTVYPSRSWKPYTPE